MRKYLARLILFWLFEPIRFVFVSIIALAFLLSSFYDGRCLYAFVGWVLINLAWSSGLNHAWRYFWKDKK